MEIIVCVNQINIIKILFNHIYNKLQYLLLIL